MTFTEKAPPPTQEDPDISAMDALAAGRMDRDAQAPEAEADDPKDRLRAVRDHLGGVHQIAGTDDSMGIAWLLLGAQSAAIDTILQYLIGDE